MVQNPQIGKKYRVIEHDDNDEDTLPLIGQEVEIINTTENERVFEAIDSNGNNLLVLTYELEE